jgi:uncharacterized protein (DUF433 family)
LGKNAVLDVVAYFLSNFSHRIKKPEIMETIANRITIDDAVCNGKPTIRGKRITVQTILEFLGAGDSPADILQQYPGLEPEDITACLRFASELMNRSFVIKDVA